MDWRHHLASVWVHGLTSQSWCWPFHSRSSGILKSGLSLVWSCCSSWRNCGTIYERFHYEHEHSKKSWCLWGWKSSLVSEKLVYLWQAWWLCNRACYIALPLYICGFVTLGASIEKHLSVGALIMGWGISEFSVMINTVAVYAYCNDAFPKHQVIFSKIKSRLEHSYRPREKSAPWSILHVPLVVRSHI